MTNHPIDTRSTPAACRRSGLVLVINVLLVISLSCSLPVIGLKVEPTATQTPPAGIGVTLPTPMPSPTPLPPALVESDPPPGSEISLDGEITFFFNQPMDAVSVEGAISGQPTLSGLFSWQKESVLTFKPDAPFLPGTDLLLTIGSNARSKGGLPLLNPMTLAYRTVGFLHLTEALPVPGASQVNPTSALVASFNRPVSPFGLDSSVDQNGPGAMAAPPAFSIEPPVEGEGRWINTSTYVFYPRPALAGGTRYTLRIDSTLHGLDGSPFEAGSGENDLPPEWSFTTSLPELVSINASGEPEGNNFGIPLEPEIVLTFNQPMDPESVQENFVLRGPGFQEVPLLMEGDPGGTRFAFTPTVLLERNTTYTAMLGGRTQDVGGTPTGSDFSLRLQTVPALRIVSSYPVQRATKLTYESVTLEFSAPLSEQNLMDHIVITPTVPSLGANLEASLRTAYLYGEFTPGTSYTLIVSDSLSDAWGGRLAQPFILNFQAAPYDPSLVVGLGNDVVFLTTQDTSLPAYATNLSTAPYMLGDVPLDDFLVMVRPGGYDIRQTYQPFQQRSFLQPLNIPANRSTLVTLPLTLDEQPLSPGLYYLRINSSRTSQPASPVLLVVSDVQVTLKSSSTDAFVWAVGVHDQQPVVNAPVVIYDENGNPLAVGATGEDGVFQARIPVLENPYAQLFAVVGQPGEDSFGMALISWNQGLDFWRSDVPTDYTPPGLEAYIYTDRPIYRPGHTVYFRAIARQAENGRYSMPATATLPLVLYGDLGGEIARFDLPLSAFGTAHGEFLLPADLRPGIYTLSLYDDPSESVFFHVAEYRKPEIDLQVDFAAEEFRLGETLAASVRASYYFGAPVSNVSFDWYLYARPEPFFVTDHETGPMDTRWLSPMEFPMSPLGTIVSYGAAVTRPDGTLQLEFPTSAGAEPEDIQRQVYTLEVTIRDESGFGVSERDTTIVHPGAYYIGVRPGSWTPQAGTEVSFDVLAVLLDGEPAGALPLEGVFSSVTWVRQDITPVQGYQAPLYVPEYEPVGRVSFTTGPDGQARLAFTPPEPGTYLLQVTGRGPNYDGAVTQVMLWVSGPGQVSWPALPNQRLRLALDRDEYLPGEVAQVFVPNPFAQGALALLTLERGKVMDYQILQLPPGGASLPLPLVDAHAPNVFVSVLLLGKSETGTPEFRLGTANLKVSPVAQVLNVELAQAPASPLGPGDRVSFNIKVTGAGGAPVQGEFSMAVVDKAVLALKAPNSPLPVTAFYGIQPLAVRTGLALAAYAGRDLLMPPGMGGGGDEFQFISVREDFPDTAYWNPSLVTDANGQARVELSLPDTLTTWQVDLRGISLDSQVGQATAELVTTQDLLVRPVTPSFVVAGDHLRLSAVVHNNTAQSLQVDVSIQPSGFELDDQSPAVQVVQVAAGGRQRVDWWGTVLDVQKLDLIFSAVSGNLRDSARPPSGGLLLPSGQRLSSGALPVLSYTARQSFATTGIMDAGGERLELVSLPQSFTLSPSALANGELRLELSPSLAAASLEALEALERFPYESNESMLSRFLPNLEAFRALESFGIQDPDLEARLERTLADSVLRLLSRQNMDGGWSWWPTQQYEAVSDPYITAYILFGLSRAQELGFNVPANAIERGVAFLSTALIQTDVVADPQLLDRLAFQHYALAQAGHGDSAGMGQLYELRSQLSPWAQALLALAFASTQGGESEASKTLLSDLQATANRSAGGVFWQEQAAASENLNSPVFTSAVVVYALSKRDPALPLLPDAVRWLMSARRPNGGWSSSYETAWALLALTEYMKGTGEWGGSFAFGASLNGLPVARGQAGDGPAGLSPATTVIPLSSLYPSGPNALVIRREEGPGRLYYSAQLSVNRPVEGVEPTSKGLVVSRAYYPLQAANPGELWPEMVRSGQVGESRTVRLTLVVPHDAYYVMVEDHIPSGAEIVDLSLRTSALGGQQSGILYSPDRPFETGWGAWYFEGPQIYTDRLSWAASYLPAGTYELVYTIDLVHAGEFQVLPVNAWQYYQPDVQGNSGGMIFTITP